jgi:hypothetical protein
MQGIVIAEAIAATMFRAACCYRTAPSARRSPGRSSKAATMIVPNTC